MDINWSDFINGSFEFVGACALALNVRQLMIDKEIKGVHWLSTAFFMSWSTYNLYFYPANGLFWSFAGGVAIILVNAVWLTLIIHYTIKQRRAALLVNNLPTT